MLLQKYCASKSFNIERRLFSSHSNSRRKKDYLMWIKHKLSEPNVTSRLFCCCRLTLTLSLSISLDESLSRKRGSDFDSGHFATVFLDCFFPNFCVTHGELLGTQHNHSHRPCYRSTTQSQPSNHFIYIWILSSAKREREGEKPC